MFLLRQIAALCLVLLFLVGCGADARQPESRGQGAHTSSPASKPDVQAPATQAEEPAVTTLAERFRELELAIPDGYVAEIEENTLFPSRVFYHTNAMILEYTPFYIVGIRYLGWTYDIPQEYHVFRDGAYCGAIAFSRPSSEYADPLFHQYEDHVWLAFDVYAGHGMGPGGFARRELVWYEISHPQLKEVLRFTSMYRNSSPYPNIQMAYEVTDARPVVHTYEGGELYRVHVGWTQAYSVYGDSGEIELFADEGEDGYTYSTTDSTFDLYPAPDRSGYNFLSQYSAELLEITQTGTDEQKQWLRDYIDTFQEFGDLDHLCHWSLQDAP